MKKFELPPLPYAYEALQPVISKEIMTLHHDKHHAAYVNGANAALEKLEKSRKGEMEIDMKATLRDISFNLSGHNLHSMFWPNMGSNKGGTPGGKIADQINKDFGSFASFQKEFSAAAKTTEGNGWAVLAFHPQTEQLFVIQLEKHNVAAIPGLRPLLVLDVWEHAYYLDYKNDRAKYVDSWWNVVNWDDVEKTFSKL
ncbi:MAG: superoxide dismutase [Candidatus Aenigmarchaeota archaeon]|nr:superoxide dismutase [Candidatus Aenigmarchaeota archaeon]